METPVPLVDLDRLERNLDRMAGYAAQHGLALRPHTKTHKSPRIAAEQIRRGAIGLTCATLLEAEVMAEASDDLLLATSRSGLGARTNGGCLDRERRLDPHCVDQPRNRGCDREHRYSALLDRPEVIVRRLSLHPSVEV